MRPSSHLQKLLRWSLWAGAILGIFLLCGCNWDFWRMDGHQSTIFVDGPVARRQRDLFYVTCYVTFAIFIIVGSVLLFTTLKFRSRAAGDEKAEPPEQGHGNPLIEVGLIGASVLALVIIAVPTLSAIYYTYDVPAEEKADLYEVNATGFQWWFKFEYPSEQINGTGNLIASNELVIPAGRPVRVNLRSQDVIHSFWVPKLAGKVDMIPARGNFLWFKAEQPGYYWGQCAEYCGDSHAVMRFRVVALGPKEFADWVDREVQPGRLVTPPVGAAETPQATFAVMKTYRRNESGTTDAFEETPLAAWRKKQEVEKSEDPVLITQGRKLFNEKTCSTCHAIRGQFNGNSVYPDLAHVGSRTTIAAGLLENNPDQLRRWIHDPGAVKPGNKMWVEGYLKNNIKLTPADEVALVAYLQSLK